MAKIALSQLQSILSPSYGPDGKFSSVWDSLNLLHCAKVLRTYTEALHTLHISGHKIFTSKPPILLVWMFISAQEVLLLFFCARNLCQTLNPWVCSLVLPATQSPPFLINLGLTTFCLHCHGTCKGPTPPRSPADYFLPYVGCLPLVLHLKITPPLSFPSRTMRVISLLQLVCSALLQSPRASMAQNLAPGQKWQEGQVRKK